MAGPDFLSMLGLSSNYANQQTQKGLKQQLASLGQARGAVQTGVKKATGALAPAILNAGNLANAYDTAGAVNRSAYGIGDPTLASNAFAASVKPGYELGRESILRSDTGQGTGRSGGTEADLQDYAFNQYNNWRSGLSQFDPLTANQEQGNLGIAQGNIYTGGANNLANLYSATGTAQNQAALQNAANVGAAGGNILGLGTSLLNAGAGLYGMHNIAGAIGKLPQASTPAGITPTTSGPFSWFTG